MTHIVDLAAYSKSGEIVEPAVARWQRQGCPVEADEHLSSIQVGVNAAAAYFETDGYTTGGDYDGYDLREGLAREPLALVGRWGLADFVESFQRVGEGVVTGRVVAEAAAIAYGAYGAAKLILPQLYVDDDGMRAACMRLAEEHSNRHLDTSVRKSMEIITHRAAATLAILSLKDVTGPLLRSRLIEAADEGGLVGERAVAADFQHRLGAEYLLQLSGRKSDSSNVIQLR